jgi:hypothetical protein
MIGQDYGRMIPLYEAMTVCSSTIEWLEKRDRKPDDDDFHACMAKLVKVIEEFVEFVKSKPMLEVPAASLTGLVWCVGALNSMTELVVREARELLPDIGEEFRQTTATLLNQLDSLSSRVEDILEAWEIGASQETTTALDEAAASICRSNIGVHDWREEIELISD